jgi:hypothetical protein
VVLVVLVVVVVGGGGVVGDPHPPWPDIAATASSAAPTAPRAILMPPRVYLSRWSRVRTKVPWASSPLKSQNMIPPRRRTPT